MLFLAMNLATLITLVIVLAFLGFAIYVIVRNFKANGTSCGCGCGSCSGGACGSHVPPQPHDHK